MDGFDVVGTNSVAALSVPEPFDTSLETYLMPKVSATIYPGEHMAQAIALPGYTFFRVSEEPNTKLLGSAGLTSKTYRFDCISTLFDDVCNMESALRNALHGFRGLMGSCRVTGCLLQNSYDEPYEYNPDNSDEGYYRRVAEYRITHQEAMPTFQWT